VKDFVTSTLNASDIDVCHTYVTREVPQMIFVTEGEGSFNDISKLNYKFCKRGSIEPVLFFKAQLFSIKLQNVILT